MRQSRSQFLFCNHGETIDARIDQKTFEARHSRGRESFDMISVIVDNATPRGPVDAAFALRSRTLGLERSDSCRRGKAIQGHIDQQGVASRRRGSGRGFETFPLRAAGIVDMHVGIDEPWKNGW